jgi:GntR family transcriptional regulator
MPLYLQVKEMLKEKIESGILKPHEPVSSERELEEQYNISRMTARHALSDLEEEGLVYRKQGRGTFVTQPKVQQGIVDLTSFTEEMKSRRIKAGARVLDIEVFTDDDALASLLFASPSEQFVRIQRLRTGNGDPIALETSVLRRKFCPGIEDEDLTDRSLCKALEEKYSVYCHRAEQTLEAKLADEYEAKLLGIKEREPVLYLERVTFMEDGETAIEYVRYIYPGDRYKFFVELK